jgi:hypothetical protein
MHVLYYLQYIKVRNILLYEPRHLFSNSGFEIFFEGNVFGFYAQVIPDVYCSSYERSIAKNVFFLYSGFFNNNLSSLHLNENLVS